MCFLLEILGDAELCPFVCSLVAAGVLLRVYDLCKGSCKGAWFKDPVNMHSTKLLTPYGP